MDERWLEIEGGQGDERRVALAAGLTRVGGKTADVVLDDSLSGELHLWDSPPEAVNIGGGADIRMNGEEFEEHSLQDGDRLTWAGAVLVYRCKVGPPVLEEVEVEQPAARVASGKAGTTGGAGASESRVNRRVRAGLLAELGLADKSVLGRWQQAVVRREFDVDACSKELLASSDVAQDDPRLLERSARLTRDLIMAPMQRGTKGAGRRARGAAKKGAAFFMAQVIVVGIFSLLVLLAMVVVHQKWPGFSFDEFLGNLWPFEAGS